MRNMVFSSNFMHLHRRLKQQHNSKGIQIERNDARQIYIVKMSSQMELNLFVYGKLIYFLAYNINRTRCKKKKNVNFFSPVRVLSLSLSRLSRIRTNEKSGGKKVELRSYLNNNNIDMGSCAQFKDSKWIQFFFFHYQRIHFFSHFSCKFVDDDRFGHEIRKRTQKCKNQRYADKSQYNTYSISIAVFLHTFKASIWTE